MTNTYGESASTDKRIAEELRHMNSVRKVWRELQILWDFIGIGDVER